MWVVEEEAELVLALHLQFVKDCVTFPCDSFDRFRNLISFLELFVLAWGLRIDKGGPFVA